MTKDEALKLALEALKWNWGGEPLPTLELEAITAIEQALALPNEFNPDWDAMAVMVEEQQRMAKRIAELEAQPEQEPEFFTHSVEQPYDWSEWICPDPKGYLMKCCDCGLIHEAEFGVVRYKSETEREDCNIMDDPNLQAVFRMRRSEQWSPEDTAHRAGGLPMAQPEQDQGFVGCIPSHWVDKAKQIADGPIAYPDAQRAQQAIALIKILLKSTPPQRTWNGLTNEEIKALPNWWPSYDQMPALMVLAKDIQNAFKEKNT